MGWEYERVFSFWLKNGVFPSGSNYCIKFARFGKVGDLKGYFLRIANVRDQS